VCWLRLGYACAYSRRLLDEEIQRQEVPCCGYGNERCRTVGKPAQERDDHHTFAEQFREDALIDDPAFPHTPEPRAPLPEQWRNEGVAEE